MQVAFEIPENTHETDNLLHIKDNYKKILITGKYYEKMEIDGINQNTVNFNSESF